MTTYDRLFECFATVLHTTPKDQIPLVDMETAELWDSVTSVMLLFAIEEAFDMEVDPDDLESLTSFKKVLVYLEAKGF